MLWASAGKSNISPEGQNGPGNDSNPVHWTASENVRECIDFELLTFKQSN